MHRCTGAVVLAAALVNLNTASGQVQVVMETRLLLQTIIGSGSTRTVTTVSDSVFAPGSRVRLTVQYRLTDLTGGQHGTMFGIARHSFSINGVNTAGNGTLTRSALTTAGSTPANGESDAGNNSYTWLNGASYPQSGTSTLESGLHSPFRHGLNGNDADAANGMISNGSILSVSAEGASDATIVNQLQGQWWGLYSFEFQSNPAFQGQVGFALAGNDPDLSIFRGAELDLAPLRQLQPGEFQYLPGSASMWFGFIEPGPRPPTVQVINRVIEANPLVSGDANNLMLAAFSDADFGNNIDVTILNDGGIGALGGVVSIVGDNTVLPSLVLNWDAPNAAIGQTFTVTFRYTDGMTAFQTGTVTVLVIPASGSVAALALGGMFAARRRRA